MRSSRPTPGNPWPHDMVISIDDGSQALLDLLWIREAHRLEPHGDGPPPALTDPPDPIDDPAVTDDVRASWEEAWPRLWDAVSTHAARSVEQKDLELLQRAELGSDYRAELLARMFGPSWREELGDAALDYPSRRSWDDTRVDAHRASRPRTLAESPEHRDLEALIPAWRAGLTRIVTIPCRGDYVRRIGVNGLLTTDAVRADSLAYRRALATFG